MSAIPNGILLVDKPSGRSSFDVVRRVRKAWNVKKVGHAGTLDPLASGLMVILVGNYTKASNLLLMEDKSYEARIVLGAATATEDRLGEVVARSDLSGVTRREIEIVLEGFLGSQTQVPPCFSAIKIDGERCYKKARRGESVEMKPRPVVFHELEITHFDFPVVDIFVRCSKGTYIRSLARDLGQALGGHAHIGELRRTACGVFTIDRSHPLEQLADCHDSASCLLKGSLVFPHLPGVVLNPEQLARWKCGGSVSNITSFSLDNSESPIVLYFGQEIVGIGRYRDYSIHPEKVWM